MFFIFALHPPLGIFFYPGIQYHICKILSQKVLILFEKGKEIFIGNSYNNQMMTGLGSVEEVL